MYIRWAEKKNFFLNRLVVLSKVDELPQYDLNKISSKSINISKLPLDFEISISWIHVSKFEKIEFQYSLILSVLVTEHPRSEIHISKWRI